MSLRVLAILWVVAINAEGQGWEGFRNRLVPDPPALTRQDFGYRDGRIGGWIQRSTTPAWYAKAIRPVTLEHRLSASGKFAVTRNVGGSGVLLGWFNSQSRGWRMPNSLVIRLDGNGTNYWVVFEYGTHSWFTGGGATYEGRYQTTKTKPFAADGTSHTWRFDYRPVTGEIELILDGKRYLAQMQPEHREDGAIFDRFGIVNQQLTGDGMEVYFDDLEFDDQKYSFGVDPQWEGKGNKIEFRDRVRRPFHDFGHTPTRQLGGIVWRDEQPAFYGAPVGPFSLKDKFYASGTIRFAGAGSDSGVYIGFFDAESKRNKTTPDHQAEPTNLVAILIEGPSRVGHYFRGGYRNALGQGMFEASGPTIKPNNHLHHWSLEYNGDGEIVVTFDDHRQVTRMRDEHKAAGGRFDRFGILNIQSGGSYVEIHLGSLQFTGN